LSNPYLERWRGREADGSARAEYRIAAEQGDLSVMPDWASEAIDLITSGIPAADLVDILATEAESALTHASNKIT
jgi:nitronate monooxygenase